MDQIDAYASLAPVTQRDVPEPGRRRSPRVGGPTRNSISSQQPAALSRPSATSKTAGLVGPSSGDMARLAVEPTKVEVRRSALDLGAEIGVERDVGVLDARDRAVRVEMETETRRALVARRSSSRSSCASPPRSRCVHCHLPSAAMCSTKSQCAARPSAPPKTTWPIDRDSNAANARWPSSGVRVVSMRSKYTKRGAARGELSRSRAAVARGARARCPSPARCRSRRCARRALPHRALEVPSR